MSKVDEIIESFMQIEEEQITSNPSPKEIVSIVTTVNSIIVVSSAYGFQLPTVS